MLHYDRSFKHLPQPDTTVASTNSGSRRAICGSISLAIRPFRGETRSGVDGDACLAGSGALMHRLDWRSRGATHGGVTGRSTRIAPLRDAVGWRRPGGCDANAP